MEKKVYESLEFEILEFSEMDIICESGFEGELDFGGGDGNGNTTLP